VTPEQKVLLQKHAEHFEAMASYCRECDPEELTALHAAACAISSTNCSWSAYEAGRFLRGWIEGMMQIHLST
jgi:hypothetical protein